MEKGSDSNSEGDIKRSKYRHLELFHFRADLAVFRGYVDSE